MFKKSLKRECSSQSARREGIEAEKINISSQSEHTPDFLKLECEARYKETKEKAEKNIASYFKNFIEKTEKFKKEIDSTYKDLEEMFNIYKENMGKLHQDLACLWRKEKFVQVDKLIEECKSSEKAFEAELRKQKTSIEKFEQAFTTEISERGDGKFHIASRAKHGSGYYANIIDVDKGIIIGKYNKKHYTKN